MSKRRRRSKARAEDNNAFVQDEKSRQKQTALKKITNARTAISRWQDLTTRRRTKTSNQFKGKKDSYPTVLDPEVKSHQQNLDVEKHNRALIMHFITLDRSCQEDDQVDLDFLDSLLNGDNPADINVTDKYGQTVLHEAAREWHTNVAKFLIKNNADINARDLYGRTPLHVAAATDYNEMLQVLLDCGADIEATAKGNQTPLHYAAGNDAVKSLSVLLEYGANKEAKDYKLRTPLFLAAELDRSETARELVEKGADVAVVDKAGYKCITHMIIKMAPVANMALDKFHRKDRRNRKQFYHLSHLECDAADYDDQTPSIADTDDSQEWGSSCLAKSPLEAIILHRQLDLILHPVITRLIDVKWHQFGRRVAVMNLFFNIVYVLIWTVVAVYVPWYLRPIYTFPQDGVRLVFLLIGTLFSLYFVIAEIMEIVKSRKKYDEWKKWRISEISTDLDICHPKWPDEKSYLESEIKIIEDSVPSYFQDMWNFFDWIAYGLTFVVLLTHVIDCVRTTRVPVCCLSSEGCENATSYFQCNEEDSFVNNRSLTVWNNRIFVITIIVLWLRLMKYARAFRELGPFIVMLTKLGSDILRFLYLYLEFLVPFSISFWMTFGGLNQIPSMSQVDKLIVSLYRLTLVDDYEYDEMTSYDVVMGYFLIVLFTFLSAVLCLNLFIALLSDTFQRVYDNAKANAVMQQASLLLSFQDATRKRRFQEYLKKHCDPEEQDYDDDLTTPGDDNLQKVTIQIKDQMDFLLERLSLTKSLDPNEYEAHQEESRRESKNQLRREPENSNIQHSHQLELFGTQVSSAASDVTDDTSRTGVESTFKRKIYKISKQVEDMQQSQVAQESSYRKLRSDMTEIKQLLAQLISNQTSSINRLNTSILMTRPLTSPSQYGNIMRNSMDGSSSLTRLNEVGAQELPGSIPDSRTTARRVDDDVTPVTYEPFDHQTTRLRMAEVRVNIPAEQDDVTVADETTSSSVA